MKKQTPSLLKDIKTLQTQGEFPEFVEGITSNPREVKAGFVFVACKGTQVDGHRFIAHAWDAGASLVVCEDLPKDDKRTYVQVEDSQEALGQLASAFYDHPSRSLQLVGVTGTNGKTTVVTLLWQLFRELGYTTGMLSTVENRINERAVVATHTTPNPVQLQALLAEMRDAGCTHAFMEVSSHATHQRRIAGLHFAGAVFTNISHDHLDYHGTFKNYIFAKKLFFDGLAKEAFALVNLDDKRGLVMLQNCAAKHRTFALNDFADYEGRIIENSPEGLCIEIENTQAWFRLSGAFNASNLLAAYGVATELGEPKEEVLRALSVLPGAPGRLQRIEGEQVTAFVDYAHTPDALKNVLETLGALRQHGQQLTCIVGCGGDRDRKKRPEMAKIAASLADRVIFTSDNPRSEDPEAILAEMAAGVPPELQRRVFQITNRREAIRMGIVLADLHGVILIAGKGHETYQEIKGERQHFDDREEARKALEERAKTDFKV